MQDLLPDLTQLLSEITRYLGPVQMVMKGLSGFPIDSGFHLGNWAGQSPLLLPTHPVNPPTCPSIVLHPQDKGCDFCLAVDALLWRQHAGLAERDASAPPPRSRY